MTSNHNRKPGSLKSVVPKVCGTPPRRGAVPLQGGRGKRFG